MITNKIKSLLALHNLSFASFARKMGIMPQTLNNKAKKDNYSISNLLDLADLTNTQLAFINKDTKEVIITFNIEDLKEDIK